MMGLLALNIGLVFILTAPAEPSCHHKKASDTDVAASEPASDSLYQLDLVLTDQEGRQASLKGYAGQPLLVSMFYGSCKSVCPLIISTLQRIDAALPAEARGRTRVLLVSLDPETDTPALLATVAATHKIDTTRWSLSRAEPGDVRLLAAALGIKYKKQPDGVINHSSVITAVAPSGAVLARMVTLADPIEPLTAVLAAFH